MYTLMVDCFIDWRWVVVVEGNVLHHVKWRGIVGAGECPGTYPGGICPGDMSGSLVNIWAVPKDPP